MHADVCYSRIVRFALLSLALIGLACEGDLAPPIPDVALTSDEWAPAGPLPTAIPEDEPFDVRLVRLDPEQHVGQERVCDVSWAGRLTRLAASERPAYVEPISTRRLVRCRAATGEGWADLVFDAASAALATYVDSGDRIRVRVLEGRGYDDQPLLAFVAAIDDVEIAPRREEPVGLGATFDRPGGEGQVIPCAVGYVGGIERLDDANGSDSHRVPVRCRHADGSDWIELRLPRITATSALRLERGVIVPVRLLSIEGGEADLPIGRYEGP